MSDDDLIPFGKIRAARPSAPETREQQFVRETVARSSAAAPRPEATWLQGLASAIADCRYGEMIEFAAGVLDKDVASLIADDRAEVIALADRLHGWAMKTRMRP